MQKVLTAAQMREVDRLTTERYGIPSIILMENAAHAVARVITEKLGGSVQGKSILILCGPGNNGGDGAALARILSTQGAKIFVLLWGNADETKGDAKIQFQILERFDNRYLEFRQFTTRKDLLDWWKYTRSERTLHVIVDAVFGTGLNRPPDNEYTSFLDIARDYTLDRYGSLKVAVDVPSGLSRDGFSTECPLEADVTVTFTAPKPENVLAPWYRECGDTIVTDIGSP